MRTLTFVIPVESSCDDDLPLTPCSPSDISEAMWEDLAAQLARQRTQIPTPAAILARRCEEGYAAATICEGRIAAYTSLSPIAEDARAPHQWAVLTAGLDRSASGLPRTRVYQFASSWTDPAWRCKRINMGLRLLLVERYLQGDALALGGMIGRTSSALARLGCRLLAWNAAPFVTSLIALPASDFPAEAATGWRPPEGLELYQGPSVPLDDPTHQWERFIHCWVFNVDLAMELDRELCALMDADLRAWRSVIAAAFTRPSSLHRLAFLP